MRLNRPAPVLLALSAALSLVVTGCGSSDAESAPATSGTAADGADGAFPVTIQHAFGETVIEEEPLDVVTWGFGSTDAALALGVVPVAIPEQAYGGNDEGVLPWIADELEALGVETPTILPNADGSTVPFEDIVAAQPDVILANFSGITEEDYATLSAIAPTVAYPGDAWATPWRDVVTTVGEALGRADEAQALVEEADATIAAAAAEHPELAGKTVAAVSDTGGTFYVYAAADPRVEFLTDLGMTTAPSVSALATGESTFFFTLSYENLSQLESDILVSYAATQEEADTFLAAPASQLMPQVTGGHVAAVVGEEGVAAVSPPTILSLTWELDSFLDLLSAAA